jgi:hypothetical protein
MVILPDPMTGRCRNDALSKRDMTGNVIIYEGYRPKPEGIRATLPQRMEFTFDHCGSGGNEFHAFSTAFRSGAGGAGTVERRPRRWETCGVL